MPRYRCNVCMNEFMAPKPSCAKCGLDPATNKRHAAMFDVLATIHFDAPTHAPGVGVGYAACKPTLRVGANGDAFTGVKQVVNCEACKAAESFLRDGPPPMPPPIEVLRLVPRAEPAGVPDSVQSTS